MCILNGLDGYDIGACPYTEIPETPQFFEVIQNKTDSLKIILRWINPVFTTNGNPLDSVATIKIWSNDSLIAEIANNTNVDTLTYTDNINHPDYYNYQLAVTDTNGTTGRKLYSNEILLGGKIGGIVIWEFDKTPITSNAIISALDVLGYDRHVYKTENAFRYPLESTVEAVFVCLGVFDQNHILSEAEGLRLANYLDCGGRLYVEGGDTWYFDAQTTVHSYFEITPVSDGSAELFNVAGDTGTIFNNLLFQYLGENNWIDNIEPTTNSTRIFYNADLVAGVGVAYDAGTYKTIGTSFELGGLVDGLNPSVKRELMARILSFFDINIVTGLNPNERKGSIPDKFIVSQNYPNPFNNSTIFEIAVPEKGELKFQIFDAAGKKVFYKDNGVVSPALHKFYWQGINNSGKHVASGIYYFQFIFSGIKGDNKIQTRKMMLLK